MIKIRKYLILIFLCVIVCSVIPFNPIINTESTNPKLSVIHDITINSPQATTYDGPMEGYFPGYFGFEDTEFIHEHWGSGVSIVN